MIGKDNGGCGAGNGILPFLIPAMFPAADYGLIAPVVYQVPGFLFNVPVFFAGVFLSPSAERIEVKSPSSAFIS